MRFQCPLCHKLVAVDDSQMGNQVQCGHCNEVVSVPPSRFATGAVIADFVIMKEIGRGGMGVVYLAHQISLDRPAALKILQDSYANDAEFVVNFIKEARLAAKLNHPHIVQAYAVGEDEGVFFFAMEYIDGETMKSVLRREKVIPVDQAITIIQQVAEALDCAWKEQKLVHRDIKPDNIMLTRKNQAKLADLGLSQVADEAEDEDSDEVMGTPQYISPEQLTGAPVDIRSDIYSLGATFYQFVTGRFPYEGRNGNEIARKHLEAELEPPQQVNPDVPEAVGQIICKMMKKNVNERYQDAESLVEDLRVLRRGKAGGTILPKAFSTQTTSVPRPVMGTGSTASAVDLLKLQSKAPDPKSIPGGPGGKSISLKRPDPPKPAARVEVVADEDETNSPAEGIKPIFDPGKNINTQTNNNLVLDPKGVEDLKGFRPCHRIRRITLLVIAAVLFVGAGVIFYLYMKQAPAVPPEKAPDQPKETVSVPDSYVVMINDLLKKRKSNPAAEMDFLNQAEEFFARYPEAKTPEQLEKLTELLAAYVEIDNRLRVEPARQKARGKHEASIAALRKSEEDLARQQRQLKEEQERLRREQEQYRKQLAEEQQRQKARDDKYMAAIRAIRAAAPYYLARLIQEDKPEQAEALRLRVDQELGAIQTSTPGVLQADKELKSYLAKLVEELKKSREYYTLLYNSGDALAGMQIELRNDNARQLLRVNSVRNRIIYAVDVISGRNVELKLDELDPATLELVVNRIERRRQIKDLKFYARLYENLAPDAPVPDDFWKKELKAYQANYEREKQKGASEPVFPSL
mgnify:CR=1 FL=1|jgi:serine/threonine protein kinase